MDKACYVFLATCWAAIVASRRGCFAKPDFVCRALPNLIHEVTKGSRSLNEHHFGQSPLAKGSDSVRVKAVERFGASDLPLNHCVNSKQVFCRWYFKEQLDKSVQNVCTAFDTKLYNSRMHDCRIELKEPTFRDLVIVYRTLDDIKIAQEVVVFGSLTCKADS